MLNRSIKYNIYLLFFLLFFLKNINLKCQNILIFVYFYLGPTRFNRHGSDSESSDDESDYEPSDNDSGSNETVLQDEPPEHFSRLSPGCDNLSDSVEKKRRLSFQSLDSDIKSDNFDKSEATSVYKSLKNSLYTDTQQDRYAVQQHLNDGDQNFNSSDDNKYSNCNARHAYTTKSSDISEDLVFKQTNSIIGKGETCSDNANASLNQLSDTSKMWQDTNINNNSACYSKDPKSSQVWQHTEGFRTDNFLYPVENQCISTDSKTFNDNNASSHYLTDNDLRLELKKRMQEMKSKTACIETNEMIESRTYSQYNSWAKNRQGYSHKDDEVDLSCANSFSETRASSFHQTNRIKQNFGRENNVECASSFNQQRSCRSNSRERPTQENFPNRDKNRFEYSFRGRRNDRSSSLDRNRNVRSSSRGRRRRDRSSSRDEKRHERSSSQSRINHTSNDGRTESSLSPPRNKFEHSYKHNKVNTCVSKERRDWYKSSPKEKPEWSSGPDRSRHDCSSSSESKRERSSSRDRNKLSSNSSHEKKHYENNLSRGRSRRVSNSRHDRNRRERSSSRDRSRHGSSRSVDSRSEHSSSIEKRRRSSSREGSKSSSESESRYRCNSRIAYNAPKLSSNQQTNKNDILVNQKTNIKTNESNQDIVQQCNSLQNKLKVTLNSEKIKDEESRKISTKDQPKSIERNRSERSNSKEKLLSNKKPHQKYNRMKNSYKGRYSRSHSSSSESCSSSYSSSSSHSCRPKIRSVPSVIKPVLVKSDTENRLNISENKFSGKSAISTVPQSSVLSICTKRNLDNAEINKSSNVKCGRMDGDNKGKY